MRNLIRIGVGLTMGVTLLTACSMEETGDLTSFDETGEDLELVQLEPPQEGQEMAVLQTNLGDISMVLYPDSAPNTVAHFKKLVEEGFYDNNEVFAVENEIDAMFLGASNEYGTEGQFPDDGNAIEAEVDVNVWHFSGAVSAYGEEKGIFNKRYESDSRFFIIGDTEIDAQYITDMEENDYPEKVINAYKKLGGHPQYTGYYTVFGQVIDGMDIVNRIVASEVEEDSSKPVGSFIIEKIELTTYSAADFEESSEAA